MIVGRERRKLRSLSRMDWDSLITQAPGVAAILIALNWFFKQFERLAGQHREELASTRREFQGELKSTRNEFTETLKRQRRTFTVQIKKLSGEHEEAHRNTIAAITALEEAIRKRDE